MASQRSDHPVGRSLSPSKAILLAMALVLLSLAAWLMQGTHAFFSDTETSTGNTFTAGVWLIGATVDIDPDTLKLTSKGVPITCYIELPTGYDVEDIVVSSILLEGTISAETEPAIIGDHDSDGIPDLMVKFDRQTVISYLDGTTRDVTLTVSGEAAGVAFEGSDTIKVISPPKAPKGLTIFYSEPVFSVLAATGDREKKPIARCLTLDWEDNTEDDLAGYKVYRSLESGQPYDFVAETKESSYADCGLESGTYFYVVTAFDQAGNESDYSNEASGTIPEPTPTETPTPTPTLEPTETVEPTPEPTETLEPTPTEEPTEEPTDTPTPEPTETAEPTPTEEPTQEPTPEPTEEPTGTPTPEPTEEPTATPIPTDTPTPTETPTPTPTSTPEPTATPTEEPTEEPTETSTPQPTETVEPTPGAVSGGRFYLPLP